MVDGAMAVINFLDPGLVKKRVAIKNRINAPETIAHPLQEKNRRQAGKSRHRHSDKNNEPVFSYKCHTIFVQNSFFKIATMRCEVLPSQYLIFVFCFLKLTPP